MAASLGAIKEKKSTHDFTVGSPWKLILSFYGPLLMTSLLQQFYNFVDTWIVGRGLGDNALAAVGNMGSLFFLIVGFSFGLSNGFGVVLSQSFGAKDVTQLRHQVAGTIVLGICMAVFMSIGSIFFLPNALRFLQTDEIIMADSLRYGYIVFGGLSAGICYNISGAVLRAFGDSKTPLKAIIASSIINIVLDASFIFVFKTGVEGAAIATICAQIVSASIYINRLRKIEMIQLTRADFANGPATYYHLVKNGIPMALMNSITAVGCMVVQYFVNGFGVVYTAAYSACSKYLNLFMNPAATAGTAMSAYAGQNYGAGKIQRIKDGLKLCLGIALTTYILLGGLMIFFPRQLAGFLLSGQEQINLVCEFLPICGVMIIVVDVLFVVRSCVQGMGKPMLPLVSGIFEMFLRIVTISTLMGRLGFRATAFAEISAWTGAFVINIAALYIALHKSEYSVEKESVAKLKFGN